MSSNTMLAAVLEQVNTPYVIKEVERPLPAEGEVLIKLKAAALNHRDVWIKKGQYAGLKFPIICGSDGCGIVDSIGLNVQSSLLNKEVIINPSLNWGDNPRVQAKDYIILGLPKDGTFAGYVCVPAALVQPKPTHLNAMQAAAFPLAGLTAFRALFGRAKAVKDENVLVTGAGGGVALFAIQFALAAGCKVFVTSGSDDKLQKAYKLGVSGGANYRHTDWHKPLAKESGGFDVIIDGAGGDDFAKLVDLTKPGGRIAVYGATNGIWNAGVPAKIFWKQIDILGSTMGNNTEFNQMIQFINEHRLEPIIDEVFPLSQTEEASQHMENAHQFGKIILQID